ncbi:MFS transporter [Pusillimonas sp.]|uniref:MFS transporter n=1 Tax=Pusillimonas sp. TaxID=3040095 RepID=UPI0029A951B2|nr:MFS transporter [Pusillimonas sp.]MDX3895544.1 MFS transporter [Pusillimonas sp.]
MSKLVSTLQEETMHAEPASAEGFRDSTGRIYQGWKTTMASMAGAAVGPSCILVFCFGSFIVPLQNEFGWRVDQISFGATIISLMMIVTALGGGALVDRVGCRRLIVWSMPLFAAGVAAMSRLPADIGMFYAALIAVAILGLGVWPVTYTKATASWFDRRLGLSIAMTYTGLGIGAALMPALLAHVIPTYGWRNAFIILGLLALLPWPIALLYLRERRVGKRAADSGQGHRSVTGMSFREAARTTEFKLLIVTFAILGAASATVITQQVRVLVDAGISMPSAMAMQSVLGIALIVGRLGTGWLLDRISASRIMVVLCLAGTVSLAFYAAGSPFNTALLSAALFGALIGAELDVLGFLIPRYFGFRAYGAIWGSVFSAFQLFSGIAIALSGLARTQLGSYTIPFTVLAALLLFAAVLFGRLGPYRYASQT